MRYLFNFFLTLALMGLFYHYDTRVPDYNTKGALFILFLLVANCQYSWDDK